MSLSGTSIPAYECQPVKDRNPVGRLSNRTRYTQVACTETRQGHTIIGSYCLAISNQLRAAPCVVPLSTETMVNDADVKLLVTLGAINVSFPKRTWTLVPEAGRADGYYRNANAETIASARP